MSFILDALRKSEHERQRQTGPALVETPVAVPKPKSNTWAVAAIALLVVNLVAIGGLLLWKSRDEPATAAAAQPAAGAAPAATAATTGAGTTVQAPTAQASITQTLPQPAPAAPPPMLRPAAEPADASAGNSLEREAASGAPAMELEAAVAAATPPPGPAAVQATRRGSVVYQELPEAGPMPGTSSAPAAGGGSSTSDLPTADEFMGRGLPEMRLELHFYASRPQERFVFVNGRRYREGDTTAEGVAIVEIVPDGVVMNQGGNRFLLPRP